MRSMWRSFRIVVAILGLAALGVAETPDLGYRVDANWPSLPRGTHFAEVSAATVDKTGNVYVFHRGEQPIMVFSPEVKLLRSFGKGLFSNAHEKSE